MRLPTKSIERACFQKGFRSVIGIDEVGMGCLAGPVVVCAVAFTRRFYAHSHRKLRWLRDSKLLTAAQRERFAAALLKDKGLRYRIGYCFPKTIDRLNIYQAARLAMRRAITRLAISYKLQARSLMVLVDGKTAIRGLGLEQIPVVGGDHKVFAIACASIIAKVFRDRMMKRYAKKYPGYGLELHKGYGTKLHRARLTALGPLKIHRKSFAPVAKLV